MTKMQVSPEFIRLEGIRGRWNRNFYLHQTKEKAQEDIQWLLDRVRELQNELDAVRAAKGKE